MKQVNIHEAKTHLSRLLEEVAGGAEVIIAKAGKPVAKLSAYQPAKPKRRLGGWLEGQIWEAPGCWDPDPELEALFNDGPVFPDEEADEPTQGKRVAEESP